jgi:processive 1,2-diacylglycerol beta-glucosyltransferase
VGSGHRRAAEAVYHCLEKGYPELTVTLVDILDYTNFWFAKLYNHGYTLLVTHLKFIWAAGYHLSSFKCVRCFSNFFGRLNSSRFIKLLLKEQADIVLATHFFPAAIVAYLKGKAKIDSRLVTIMTDFCVHPLWVFKNCDDYIVGSDFTRNRLIDRGINQDKIRVLGIAISSGFSSRHQEEEEEEEEGLTALLVTGSFGFSLIEKVVGALYSKINLLVVCGNNQRLYNRLEQKRYIGVRLFGFTEDIPKLMSQADIIITKPGGLTIAEALVMELPLIFIGSIPGQETENARILESYGCAIDARNLKSLKDIIISLKAHPERLDSIRGNIKKIRKPNATEEICRYVKRSPDLWSDSEHNPSISLRIMS